MRVRMLSLECECGRRCSAFAHVGLTDDRQLMFEWRCADCGRAAYALKGLSDCWRECSAIGRSAATAPKRQAAVVKFLRWRLS